MLECDTTEMAGDVFRSAGAGGGGGLDGGAVAMETNSDRDSGPRSESAADDGQYQQR